MATEKEVYDALVGRGFSMAQAAGIMGNIQNESSYNQEAVGDAGTSFGLVQWHVPGYPFAPSLVTNHPADDFADQIPYIVQASHGVNMGGDAAAVAGAWASQFERCVGCQPGGAQFISRQQNAQRIFQQAQTGKWPSGPGTPGGPGPGNPNPVAQTVSSPGIQQVIDNWWGFSFPVWEVVGPVTGSTTAVEDIAQAVAGIGNVLSEFGRFFAWWFVPSHIVRVVCAVLGIPLIGVGIFNLTRTGAPYNVQAPVIGSVPMSGGNLAPAIGIAEITVGSILLFIALHNLPQTVTDLPSLLTYIQSGVSPAGAPVTVGTV